MRALLIIYAVCNVAFGFITGSRKFLKNFASIIIQIINIFKLEFNLIQHDDVEKAMKAVDRKNFCEKPKFAYQDAPQNIGEYSSNNLKS